MTSTERNGLKRRDCATNSKQITWPSQLAQRKQVAASHVATHEGGNGNNTWCEDTMVVRLVQALQFSDAMDKLADLRAQFVQRSFTCDRKGEQYAAESMLVAIDNESRNSFIADRGSCPHQPTAGRPGRNEQPRNSGRRDRAFVK